MSKLSLEFENLIATKLEETEVLEIHPKYRGLYSEVGNEELELLLTKLHSNITETFKAMNSRLPTKNSEAHFWAEESRILIMCIRVSEELHYGLQNTDYPIIIDNYYLELFEKCNNFLSPSGGSAIPKGMERVELYFKKKIFGFAEVIAVSHVTNIYNAKLRKHGEGSYALILRYRDDTYGKNFIVKRAKNNLSAKELERFKIEYDTLSQLDSPHIVEVFSYNENKNEYIMEFMDITLKKYIDENNGNLDKSIRKRIILQILRAFKYIHSKSLFHRDISPNNVLLNLHDDGSLVVKVSDFGLIKREESDLTSPYTEHKGSFNDPGLVSSGFDSYNITHEVYAITYLIYYIMTGRTVISPTKNNLFNDFVQKGMSPDTKRRFEDLDALCKEFYKIKFT